MTATMTQRGARLLAATPAPRPRGIWHTHAHRSGSGVRRLAFRVQRPQPHVLPSGRRRIHLAAGSLLMPPLIFTGLFLALWTYKCIMLVLFQNVIIYNPFLPPNARSMLISDYARQCGKMRWREERIRSLDGTEIALCVGEMATDGLPGQRASSSSSSSSSSSLSSSSSSNDDQAQAYILYFQGNASSLPPRLPDISGVLRQLAELDETAAVHLTVICVSYRGFWTSHDRPSEKGINLDTEAALRWVSSLHGAREAEGEVSVAKPAVVLWGQSVGCGFATNLAANVARESEPRTLRIDALVLETPFTNTRAMLQALYPQRWLPYQHLWPFLRNHLDSLANLETIARGNPEDQKPAVYIVEAGKDELVPHDHGTILHRRCQDVGLYAEKRSIRGALHNDVMVRKDGKQALARSLASAISRAGSFL